MIDELVDEMNYQAMKHGKPIDVILLTHEQRDKLRSEAKILSHLYISNGRLEYFNGALVTVPKLKGGSHPCTTLDYRPEAERGQMMQYTGRVLRHIL